MQSKSDARRRVGFAAALVASAVAVSAARADLKITNGNFETYDAGQTPGGNYPGVYQWFNAQNPTAPWWYNVSQATAVSPTGTASVVLTGNHDATGGVPIPWLYQSIGFNTAGLTSLPITFDLGGFTDNNPISAHIDVQLFKASGFAGADNTDILGAAGVTQVGSTFSVERLNFAGSAGVINVPATFDLTGVSATDELFLRFQSTVPDGWTGSNYVRLDNVRIVGTTRTPVALTWVGLAAGGTWDEGTTAHFKNGSTASAFLEGDMPTFDNTGAVDGSNVSLVNVGGGVTTGNVVISSTHDYSFSGGAIVGAAGGTTLTKRGAGKATFTNPMTFLGGVTIEAGTVELTGTASSLNGPLVNNGTLISNRVFTDPDAINEWDPLALEMPISGTGSIVIKNHTILGRRAAPAGENTFTGTVTVEAGAFVYLGGVSALGSTAGGTIVQSGGTLASVDDWHMGADAIIDAEPITLNGMGTSVIYTDDAPAGALFQYEGNRTWSGPIHLGSTSLVVVRDDQNTEAVTTMKWSQPVTAEAGAGLMKDGFGTLQLAGGTAASLDVFAGKVVQNSGVLKVKSLSLAAPDSVITSRLQLNAGAAVVVDYDGTATPFADLSAKIVAGEITALGTVDLAKHVLGIINTSSPTTIGGTSVDGSSVVMRVTLKGDSDLSGKVEFADLLTLAKNYNGTGKLYQQGDTDYNGKVEFADLLALAKNYNQTVAAADVAGFSADFQADLALAQSLVPEPASLSLIAGAAMLAGARRRRSGAAR